jgi:hypothetical protein
MHHDIASAHTSLLVCECLAKRQTIVGPKPPHYPDLVPADFLSPKGEIYSERSPISDDRRDTRKFATVPTPYPAKRFPELENVGSGVEAVWGGGCFEGDKPY